MTALLNDWLISLLWDCTKHFSCHHTLSWIIIFTQAGAHSLTSDTKKLQSIHRISTYKMNISSILWWIKIYMCKKFMYKIQTKLLTLSITEKPPILQTDNDPFNHPSYQCSINFMQSTCRMKHCLHHWQICVLKKSWTM